MPNLSLHLAPNAPWLLLLLFTLGAVALSLWAYRFAIPPLPAAARRALPALRLLSLAALVWLLAQPVLERAQGGAARVVVLLDRSRSMDLPERPGGRSRADAARDAVRELERSLRGRAGLEVLPFADGLGGDSASAPPRGATALGEALQAFAESPDRARTGSVVVVSDGEVNRGADPVAVARAMGLPVHAVVVGAGGAPDRAVSGVDAPDEGRVGQPVPVRVHVTSSEPRGTPIGVRLLGDGREIGRATAIAPGGGAEATVEFRESPGRAGLAVWTARVDSLAGEMSTRNNSRQVALQVAPGRLGVGVLTSGLNWDLAFLRRALLGDSSLALTTWVRERDGWRALERGRGRQPAPGELGGLAVVVLDALDPASLDPALDRALSSFVRGGGGLLVLGGPVPGLLRMRSGALAALLQLGISASAMARSASPAPTPEASELIAWDDDAARGARAWQAAAPLQDLAPIVPSAGDRVLIGSAGSGPPLFLSRHAGRGQVLMVNGTGLWRWSLSPLDDLTMARGHRLWRNLIRWLAEPVQGEPLRVRPERWLSSSGEAVRLDATLQDEAYRPVAGAAVEGELSGPGRSRPIAFAPGSAGGYSITLSELPPGRYRVTARATRGGRELGRAASEFAVDRWSLEEARADPDSATLAAVARASGGSVTGAANVRAWARSIGTRTLARGPAETVRLWESPWLFAMVVGALGLEWAWRRRRGLP